MFVEVSHQGHDHHWVDSQDVPHPAVQNPVLQDEPRQQKKSRMLSSRLSTQWPTIDRVEWWYIFKHYIEWICCVYCYVYSCIKIELLSMLFCQNNWPMYPVFHLFWAGLTIPPLLQTRCRGRPWLLCSCPRPTCAEPGRSWSRRRWSSRWCREPDRSGPEQGNMTNRLRWSDRRPEGPLVFGLVLSKRSSCSYQYVETAKVFAMVRLQPDSIVVGGVAAEEQGTVVGNHDHDENDQSCQHYPAGQRGHKVPVTTLAVR